MLAYLLYDQKDIDRGTNRNFINWLIEEAQKQGLTLELVTQENYKDKQVPDFVVNRSRLAYLSDYFGVMAFNSSEVTKIANDKWLTYQYFKDSVPMLKTYRINDDYDYPCVVKKRNGHGGSDVHWLDEARDFSDDYIAQAPAPKLGKDLRVYILNNDIYVAILRTNETNFKSNYSLGGQARLYDLKDHEKTLVQTILDKLPIFYGGIDFLFDQDDQLILNEIEDPVGAMMVYNLTDKDIVIDFMTQLIEKVKEAQT